ncbi:hypothetical protein FM120_07975 [Sphingobacterium faecium PCAi_F2.5]|nr:hypothetical protein FM120_07975 [Sphingobacterium faecium PCAi_F2.5]
MRFLDSLNHFLNQAYSPGYHFQHLFQALFILVEIKLWVYIF